MRSRVEWEEAWRALHHALAADDTGELLRRLRVVPRWIWDEGPAAKEKENQEAICALLRVIKGLAECGNGEAAEYLAVVLEDNPFLQLLFLAKGEASA